MLHFQYPSMLSGESEGLQKLNPFSMPGIEFRLAVEELQGLMIKVKNKSLRVEIMTLMTQCSDYCIEFFIIG